MDATQSTAVLVTLRDGRTYAAAEHRIEDGWLHMDNARRYVKIGPEGARITRFHGPIRSFKWPRELVQEVKTAAPA